MCAYVREKPKYRPTRLLNFHWEHGAAILWKEAVKMVCSCQYMNCVDLWVTFISGNVHDYDLQPLLYMVIQIINGVALLFPDPRYFPMKIKCVQWLNQLSNSSGIFIPVASLVFDILEYDICNDGGKSGKDLNFSSVVKVEQNIEYVRKKRDEVAFSPNNQQSADSFLQLEKFSGSTPFTQYYRNVMEKASSRNLGIKEKKSFPVERKSKKRRNINVDSSVNIENPASNKK